jgi:ABC-2 type transport system ATP-binding protein
MQPILDIQEVDKFYANHRALSQVSISVPKGSIFGLLGPNGAGKTSLIRIINQITGPDGGRILFEGKELEPKHVERIGYLPEERGLYRKMKVGEQATYLCMLKGLDKKTAHSKLKNWFEKFEIVDWWNKKVEELSKGMQQKVQFIVTVLHEPELIILDEPFSGFDPINTNLIKSEILDLRDKGTTVIFSTHNMASVEEICDHIALINKSKKILDGSMKEVKETYRANIYELTFKGNKMGFTNALWTGAELLDFKEQDGLNYARVKLLRDIKSNDLLRALLPVAEIHSLNEVLPSMNDIFIQKVTEIEEADE